MCAAGKQAGNFDVLRREIAGRLSSPRWRCGATQADLRRLKENSLNNNEGGIKGITKLMDTKTQSTDAAMIKKLSFEKNSSIIRAKRNGENVPVPYRKRTILTLRTLYEATRRKAEFIKLRAEGKSYSFIAETLHISKSTCTSWERELKDQIAQLKGNILTNFTTLTT